MLVLTAFLVGLAGVLLGAWWAPFVAGAFIALMVGRARMAIPLGGLTGLASWLLPLVAIQVRYGLNPTAESLAAIMGFSRDGAIPIALSLIVGGLLGLVGAWLASAARTVVRPAPR